MVVEWLCLFRKWDVAVALAKSQKYQELDQNCERWRWPVAERLLQRINLQRAPNGEVAVDTNAVSSEGSIMIVTTGNDVAGYSISEYLGIVRGIVVRSPSITQGFLGGLKQIVGGNRSIHAKQIDLQ